MYRTTAFFFSKVIAGTTNRDDFSAEDLPIQVLSPTITGLITYFIIGFDSSAANFFIFWVILLLISNIGGSLGLFIGTIAKDSEVAISLVPIIIMPFMIFSGYFVNRKNTPPWFIWVEWISFIRYAFEGVIINEVIRRMDLYLTPYL
jgi:ABC-type multidrug transport system permease subunit